MKAVLTSESEHASGFLVDAGDAGAPLKVFGKKDAEVGFCWTSWRIVLLREYKKKDEVCHPGVSPCLHPLLICPC